MAKSRVYIGNLSFNVSEDHIKEIFSEYGETSDLEIKCKYDFEGEPVSRFAYLNLQSDKIQECIQGLDGYQLEDTVLKVQAAKESFIDRLKRERKEIGDDKNLQNDDKPKFSDENYNFSKTDHSNFQRNYENSNDEKAHQTYNNSDFNNSFKNIEPLKSQQAEFQEYNKNAGISDHNFSQPYLGFKRFDPSKKFKKDEIKQSKSKSSTPQNLSTNKESEKAVEVLDEINFGSSSNFSFTKAFSEQIQKLETIEQKTQSHIPVYKSVPQTSMNKRFNFFIDANHPELIEAASWLTTPLTTKNEEEFASIRPQLISLYKSNMKSNHKSKTSKKSNRRYFTKNKFK